MLFKRYAWVFSMLTMLAVVGSTISWGISYLAPETSIGGIALGAASMFLSTALVLTWSEAKTRDDDIESLELTGEAEKEFRASAKNAKLLKELRTVLGIGDDNALLSNVRDLMQAARDSSEKIARAEANAKHKSEVELKTAVEQAESRGEQVRNLQKRIRELEAALSTNKEKLRLAQAQSSEWEGQIGQLTFFRDLSTKLSEEKLALEAQLADSTAAVQQASSRIDVLTSENAQTQAALKAAQAASAKLNASLDSQTSTLEAERAESARREAELLALRFQLSKAREDERCSGSTIEKQGKELETLRRELSQANAKRTELEAQSQATILRKQQLELRVANFESAQAHAGSFQRKVPIIQANKAPKQASVSDESFKAMEDERNRLLRVFDILVEKFPDEVEAAFQATES